MHMTTRALSYNIILFIHCPVGCQHRHRLACHLPPLPDFLSPFPKLHSVFVPPHWPLRSASFCFFFCFLTSVTIFASTDITFYHRDLVQLPLSSSAAFFNFLCFCLTAWCHFSVSLRYILCSHYDFSQPESHASCLRAAVSFATFSEFSLALSHSLSYRVSFILSSSLSYIIQANASHSEIKARACSFKRQTPCLRETQSDLCPWPLKRRKCLQ